MAHCFWGSTRTRCPYRHIASALEVLAANGVNVMIAQGYEYTPTPAVSHAILNLQPRAQDRTRRRHRHHTVTQSAT